MASHRTLRGGAGSTAGPGHASNGRQRDKQHWLMETHEVRYFLSLARELNFTRAAEASGVSQPALTRAIQKLEVELGGALFLRRPGQVELTRLGREVLPQLEAIESTMVDVQRRAQSVTRAASNSLRLGAMCTIGPGSLV